MSFNITPVASGYQEIHPYSAMNIDSVKINTSLIMMKECEIRAWNDAHPLACVVIIYVMYLPDIRKNTRVSENRVPKKIARYRDRTMTSPQHVSQGEGEGGR